MTGLDFGEAAGQDVRGAVQHLKGSGSAKVAVTGYCMGGALTVLAACNVPEADAFIAWYGFPPLDYVDASKIKAPMLGHFSTQDEFFAIAKVDELEKKLRAAGAKFDFHRYDAKHAFANETAVGDKRPVNAAEYNPKAAELAWKRTMDFLAKTLQ
jgi:carboxymethylenebutenolidase